MSHVRLTSADLEKLAQRGWRASEASLEKTFQFESYGDGMAFAVALAFLAEKRDHHPDLHISWARVRVVWTTHDAGGTTHLDAELAAETERLSGCSSGQAAPISAGPPA